MARFRSNKRAKELQRKAKHEAKELVSAPAERAASGEADDDIDWSQAVGVTRRPAGSPGEDEASRGRRRRRAATGAWPERIAFADWINAPRGGVRGGRPE
jgi:hypothetical protein